MKTRKSIKDGQGNHYDNQSSYKSSSQDSVNSSSDSLRRSSRSSKRIQNMQKSTPSSGQLGLVDSAYDADEESVTPNSSPDQQAVQYIDPYEIDMIEDVPFVNAKQRKTAAKKAKKQPLAKRKLKSKSSPLASKKSAPTSTPVLQSSVTSKLQQGQAPNSATVTPEVTPILPYKSHESVSLSDDRFETPQIYRSSKKRSLQPDPFDSLSTQLSYSTHGDSGIALSPVSKKHCLTLETEKHITELESKTTKLLKKNICNKIKKGYKHSSSVFDRHKLNQKNIFKPVTEMNIPEPHKTESNFIKIKMGDDSCFGFDSLDSPVIASENSPPPPKPKRLKNSKRAKKVCPSKDTYRVVHKNSSDSSVTCNTNMQKQVFDSENSPKNVRSTKSAASPTLFSDSFSADSESLEMDINKSSVKSYSKPSKIKKAKERAAATKLDMWASNFNMEIEDIEKFDLNIE